MRRFAFVTKDNIIESIVVSVGIPVTDNLLVELYMHDQRKEGEEYDTSEIPKKPKDKWKGYTPIQYWSDITSEWVSEYLQPLTERYHHLHGLISASDYKASKAVKLNQPFEELYPGEKEKYVSYVSELNQLEVYITELKEKE